MPDFLSAIDLEKRAIDAIRVQNISSAPSSPVTGQLYFNTTVNRLFIYNGSKWNPASTLILPRAKDNGGGIRYTVPGIELSTTSTTTLTVNQLRYAPFIVETPLTIDQLAVEVTTGIATGKIRLGIYNADNDLQPTSLITDTGEIDVSTTGVKSVSVSLSLSPGNYLSAFNVNIAAVAVRILRGGVMYTGLQAALGSTPFAQSMRVPLTYATLTDPGTTWASSGSISAQFEHVVVMRVSAP